MRNADTSPDPQPPGSAGRQHDTATDLHTAPDGGCGSNVHSNTGASTDSNTESTIDPSSSSSTTTTTGSHPSADDPAAVQPRVSVVVPTYRRPELLRRCLYALLRQNLAPWAFEVIVVDDAHSAHTEHDIANLSRAAPNGPVLRYLRPAHGRGPAVARNTGWRAARAAMVAFTDDDTIPQADWLACGMQALDVPGRAAVAGRVVVPRPAHIDALPTDHELMTRGLENAAFVTANAFVWRHALQRVGGFDERFLRAWREDSDLQYRLEQHAGTVARCEQAVVLHPVRPERWGVSLRQQRNVFFDALLYREHPQRYRQQVLPTPPWNYYAIVVLSVAAAVLALAGNGRWALACLLPAAALVLHFAWRRLRHTARAPAHVLEMLLTSAAIPFLSVYWRLRGALHFRVWFW